MIALAAMLLAVAFPNLLKTANAQTESSYYVTVSPSPTSPSSPMYTPVGRNWTLSFEATWSYGNDSGKPIGNATVTIQVSNTKKDLVSTLNLNSTEGLFSFNYSSSTAEILTFIPAKLTTQDGTEWTPKLLDGEKNLYGFQSKSVTIWWDTFHASLVSYRTSALGVTAVSANVTYLLLPEEGLNLPESATYSHQTFLPKTVQNASVTINGVNAVETSPGMFAANVSTWLPTAYVLVEVSQQGWVATQTGFSFAHSANELVWTYAAVIGLLFAIIVLTVVVLIKRRKRSEGGSIRRTYAIPGGTLLLITSVISLYWGLAGLDSSLHGFNWIFLTIMGLLAFGFGLIAGIFSVRRKSQSLAIFAVIVPLLTNSIFVKSSLDLYQLAVPWWIMIVSLVLSIISGFLICNADEVFT